MYSLIQSESLRTGQPIMGIMQSDSTLNSNNPAIAELQMAYRQLAAVGFTESHHEVNVWKPEDTAEALACVDVEQRVVTIVSVRAFLGRIDSLLIDGIMSGKLAPIVELHKVILTIDETFRQICPEILETAERYAKRGYAIKSLQQLQEICRDPSAGLMLVQMAKAAADADTGNGMPRESAIAASVYDRLELIGASYRHLGND